jgi:hypothetical protein
LSATYSIYFSLQLNTTSYKNQQGDISSTAELTETLPINGIAKCNGPLVNFWLTQLSHPSVPDTATSIILGNVSVIHLNILPFTPKSTHNRMSANLLMLMFDLLICTVKMRQI